MGEFDLIKHYFSHHKRLKRPDIIQNIGDDCAVLTIPHGQQLAISTDTLVAGTHFLPTISADNLAYKAVTANLSDLAAMGAKPAWASLALTLPEINEQWLNEFSLSLFKILNQYQVALIGGDTTKGPLSLTLTVQGFLTEGKGLFRHNAQVGDAIFVSGTLGDSAGGLSLLLDQCAEKTNLAHQQLLERHFRPTARIELGQCLIEYCNCALDISDGLLADLGHILEKSNCGAELWLEKLPLSDALLQTYSTAQAEQFALCGGEDYELCFTVPPKYVEAIAQLSSALNLPCHCIGKITDNGILKLLKHQQPYPLPPQSGFQHFNIK